MAESFVIFLNRFFHPDHSATSQMLSDLAFALAAEGRSVVVITSRQRYDDPAARLPARETVGGVEIHRVWTSRFGRADLVGRAIDYLSFYLSAAWALWRLARPGAVVVAKTDPPMLSIVAGPVARWRGAAFVNWLQDIFPEVAVELGVGESPTARVLFRILGRLRDASLRRATVTIAIGDRMAQRVVGFGVPAARVRVIANWADGTLVRPIAPQDNPLRAEWGVQDAVVVGYSGNLGRAHDYRTILDAIARLERDAEIGPGGARVVWLFIGGGAQHEAFRREVSEMRLSSVRFAPYQPREQLAQSLSVPDVHLVTLRPELEGLIVPSKFYGVAAAGRPAVFVGDADGEIARLLQRHDCGTTVAEGDAAGLARIVVELASRPADRMRMGDNARTAFMRHHDKPVAVAQWRRLLDELASKRGAGARLSG